MTNTILDTFLSEYAIQCTTQTIDANENELVHIVGAQEPVRDQPDERSRMLLRESWLMVESLEPTLATSERKMLVLTIQQAATEWLSQSANNVGDSDHQQIRWLVEKTRPHESKQQIAHRVWLALILHSQGHQNLRFDANGYTSWDEGIAGRIGMAPDDLLDVVWEHGSHTAYATSFRAPDGTIARGKGRQRWHVYRLTLDPATDPLFRCRQHSVTKKVALIVASETYATQPQLPRDFYGGNEFQQACIDAQDQHFDHMLVLSPEHGVISLDDIVPSDEAWHDVLEQNIWLWQIKAVQRLGMYLCGNDLLSSSLTTHELNWWLWLNPESTYVFTVFGGGFAVRVLFDHMLRARTRTPHLWPNIVLEKYRKGYIVDDFEDDFEFALDDNISDDMAFELDMQDINQLLEWATDFVSLTMLNVPPTNEVWEIEADEALIPVRLLADNDVDIENFLDLLTDITLLMEQPVPLSLIINPGIAISTLLQLTHNLVHNEHDSIQEILGLYPDDILHQYVERALQEPSQEDRLCACLTLAEQLHVISLTISHHTANQMLVWMQTYISARLRQQLLGDEPQASSL